MAHHHSSDHDIDREEQYKGGFDLSYIRRFMAFARPQALLVLTAFLLLVISLSAQLTMPNIFRLGLDRYIFPLHNFLALDSSQFESHKDLRENARLLENGLYALPSSYLEKNPDLKKFAAKDSAESMLTAYFLFPKEEALPEVGTVKGQYWCVPDSETSKIPRSQLLKMRRPDISGLKRYLLIYLLLGLLLCLADYFHRLTLEMASQRTMYALRMKLFEHVQGLSLSLYNKTPIGKLVTRVTNDIEAINSMLSTVAVQMIASFGMLIGCAVILLCINVKLALVSFVVLPPCLVITIIFRHFMRKVHRKIRRLVAKINGVLTEEFSGIKIIQAFNQQKRRQDEFKEINQAHYDAGFRHIILMGVFGPILDLIRQIGTALILLYGALWVMDGSITLGTLLAFLTYFGYLCRPLMQISDQITQLQSSMAAAERIFGLLDQESEVRPPEKAVPIGQKLGKVEFKNVDFSYIPGEPVLKNVSFTIEPGKSIAIVGPTGAGKSSIINLVSRFYDADQGEVVLDGRNVRDWPNDELRRHISIVLQGTFVFSRTISENISLGDPGIASKHIKWAADTVCASRFIERLPNGYGETMAERGATLSSGEKQLLCFARALAHDPRILILDEATSNVDPATESLIQDAIDRLMEGRTSIIVAHRLSTIRKVDEILYLENGEIKERGSHDELMAQMGAYYNLYILQYSKRL